VTGRAVATVAALSLALALVGACEDDAAAPPRRVELDPAGRFPLLTLTPAFGGREFVEPVEVGAYPDGRLFVAEQAGVVKVLAPDGSDERVILDITDRVDAEGSLEGLASVAFDPAFATNGYLWLFYYASDPDRSLLARYQVVDGIADRASELIVLNIAQPGTNQNGGAVRFGRDGMLYLSLGDGSASLDPFENGQNLGTLLGSVLRIDVSAASAAEPYRAPADNPFLEVAGARPEAWAYGFRNPWRIAFDPATDKLWGGDVGVGSWEEVDVIERGKNYGWNLREGFDCLRPECPGEDLTGPAAAVPQTEGRCAVIGGVVYRGAAIPDLAGAYLFGDFCTGEVFALDVEERDAIVRLATGASSLVSFGTDAAGEVYVVSLDGPIWRLAAAE
jgi:glucose/arabinose dehydrogenase